MCGAGAVPPARERDAAALALFILHVAVAAGFVLPRAPGETTRPHAQPVDTGDDVAEYLWRVGRGVSQLPRTVAVAVESTPKSVYQGMHKAGLAGALLLLADALFDFGPLTFDQDVQLARVFVAAMYGGALGKLQDQLNLPLRKVCLALDAPFPPSFDLCCSQSLAEEISTFTASRSDDFLLALAEPGDTDLFSELQTKYQPLVEVRMRGESSLKEKLNERLHLKTNESLMKVGEFVARIIGFRSMFVGGPFGGQKSAVFVIQVPDDAAQKSVKLILENAADLKAGAGEALDLVLYIPSASQLPDDDPQVRAKISQGAVSARAAVRKLVDEFLTLNDRAPGLGLTIDALNNLSVAEEANDARALEKAREILGKYLTLTKDDAAQRAALEAFARFGYASKFV